MKADINVFLVIFLFSMITEESSATIDPPVPAAKSRDVSDNKITIVGAGNVGMAVAISLLTQYVTDEIVLIDREENKDFLKGEIKDLQDGTVFMKSPKISGGVDYALSKNSRICIITAGFNQKPDEKREALVHENLKIFQKIIPELIKHNPNAVILVVTNPVDIMTYITWRLVGKQSQNKIIGSGTNLDTARWKFLISQDLQISPESVDGWVIAGHGDNSVTVWSGMSVAGVNFKDLGETLSSKVKDGQTIKDWCSEIDKKMVDSAMEIIKLKGKTSWAVGLSVANIANSIIHNVPNIHAVSTMVKGYHGIKDEIFMSLPCVLGENGVTSIINQPLEKEEIEKLQEAAGKMLKIINTLELDKKE